MLGELSQSTLLGKVYEASAEAAITTMLAIAQQPTIALHAHGILQWGVLLLQVAALGERLVGTPHAGTSSMNHNSHRSSALGAMVLLIATQAVREDLPALLNLIVPLTVHLTQ
jgi:hypothetical protein